MLASMTNNNQSLSPLIIDEFRKYLLDTFGLNFYGKRDSDLIKNIDNAATDFSYTNSTEFIKWILSNKLTEQGQGKLVGSFTVGETYFLREKKSFDFLEQIYLPGLIFKRQGTNRQLKIWSAGCASGEEAYTIAILLSRIIPDIRKWDITIMATDINPNFLEKAKKGVYSKWSFRNNPDWLQQNYFEKVGINEFQIIPEIQRMVQFSTLNLAEDSFPSERNNTQAFDIIFCRNVLIYFSLEGNKVVTNRFYHSLQDGGILLVSPVEMSNLITPEFEKIQYSGLTIYQKGAAEKTKKVSLQPEINKPTVQILPKTKLAEPTTLIPRAINVEPKAKNSIVVKLPEVSDFDETVKLFEKGLYDEAEKALTILKTKKDVHLPEVIKLLARTKANLGKLNEAIQLCDEALTTDKANESLYYLKATILQELGDDEAALAALNRAIYLNQDFVLAHFLLGNIYLKLGKKPDGLKHFKNATAILSKMDNEKILSESEGITVERFREILNAIKTNLI